MGLEQMRLIYVAPRSGVGGVGDYADEFAAAARHYVGEVIEYRHGSPGSDSARDLNRHRKNIRALVDESGVQNTIVHCELSGGALVPFWGTWRLGGATITATVHDPPRAVWWPMRTRFLAEHRVLTHGIHFVLNKPMTVFERRVLRGRTLFALTETGAAHLRLAMPASRVVAVPILVPERPELAPAAERPLAVGLFGLVYRGKGFDKLQQLRDMIDDDILIRVAGRGTEQLEGGPGIEIVGAIEGNGEDAFFGSIRLLIVPYGRRVLYGGVAYPASATSARGIAYQTPLVVQNYGALVEAQTDGIAIAVDGELSDLARAANSLARDIDALTGLGHRASQLRLERAPENVIKEFVKVWSE